MPELLRPQTAGEAASLVAEHGAALTILAGGTGVMRTLSRADEGYVMALDGLGLTEVSPRDGGWRIGAGVTMSGLRAAIDLPVLAEATRRVGGVAVQNMATVGGNLYAQAPYGDLAVLMLALGATLRFETADGEITRSIEEFYDAWSGGAPPDAGVLTAVDVAAPQGAVAFIKCARRQFASPAVVTVAAQLVMEGGSVSDARIALGGAGPHPARCAPAEAAVVGSSLDAESIAKAAAAASEAADPATDTIATAWYRKRMAGVFVQRALAQLA